MPMMNELLADLQENPPQNEEELRELLAETGYDLIMTEPSDEGDEYDDEEAGEESMEMMGDEEMDDMGEGDEDEDEGEGPDDANMEMDIMKEMMPMSSMMGPPKDMNPRMVMAIRTKKAAKKALMPKRGKK